MVYKKTNCEKLEVKKSCVIRDNFWSVKDGSLWIFAKTIEKEKIFQELYKKTENMWWAQRGSNLWPLRCQRSALPLSYAPLFTLYNSLWAKTQCQSGFLALADLRGRLMRWIGSLGVQAFQKGIIYCQAWQNDGPQQITIFSIQKWNEFYLLKSILFFNRNNFPINSINWNT